MMAETRPTPRTISKLLLFQVSQLKIIPYFPHLLHFLANPNLWSKLFSPIYFILTINLQQFAKPSDLIMLDDDDAFYKELPFTLTQDQTKPNFVIFGTGLQQCLIAAHYAKIHMKPSLILDFERTYGSCLKTVTIKQLHALNQGTAQVKLYQFLKFEQFQERNLKFYNHLIETKAHRGYSIDLQPNFFFGSSITCDMLKEADMDKYMDFRLVNNMLRYDGTGFKHVPLSKGKIFQSKDLGLLQKKLLLNTFHSLSQIYNKFMNVTQDLNSTKEFDKQFGQVDEKLYQSFLAEKNNNFTAFLQKLTKNNQKIMNYIIYILCNYQYNYKKGLPEHVRSDYTLQEFINRFGKFVKSCGIYGECPYLYVDNGIGDVPQAYSRIASIYQSIYILHPRIEIQKIETSEDTGTLKIYTNLYPSGFIETKQIFYGPTCYHLKFKEQTQYQREYTLRVILICQKLGTEQECPSIVYLLDLPENQNPVYLFMLDAVSHTCPDDYILYQFETVVEDRSDQACLKKIESYVQALGKTRGEKFETSILYTCAYIREKRYPKFEKIQEKKGEAIKEKLLRDHSGIDLDSHFINFKKVVGEQPLYFKKKADQNIHQEDQWQGGDQTTNLIEKLDALNLNGEQEAAQTKMEASNEVVQQEVVKQTTSQQKVENELKTQVQQETNKLEQQATQTQKVPEEKEQKNEEQQDSCNEINKQETK